MKKILINDTLRVSNTHAKLWLNWMRNTVIPLAQKHQYFDEYRITKIVDDEADDGISYACQYIFADSEKYSNFINNFDLKIQQELKNRFSGQFATFRTELEILEEG